MYYRQPRYFGDFHCIGNACPDNCCYGWRIDWYTDEVEKLKIAKDKMSPDLRELVDKSFELNVELDNQYQILFDEKGRCSFLTEDGLCRIQRELGVEYMSETCMVYPRRYVSAGNTIYSFCNMSCREVITKLINDEKAMDMVNIPVKKEKTLRRNISFFSSEDLALHPELKFNEELIEFFFNILADKKHDVETNIILGALAAQALTKLVDNGETDRIPEAIKSLRAQMHNPAQLKMIEDIKPNYRLRFGVIEHLIKNIIGFSFIRTLSDETGTPNIDYYDAAYAKLNEIFKDRPFYLRNIALNLMLELDVPFKFKDMTIYENYSLFVVSYACIKLNLISIALADEELFIKMQKQTFHYKGDERFAGLTAIFCRGICQNNSKGKLLLAYLKEFKITSPAYLALLVK